MTPNVLGAPFCVQLRARPFEWGYGALSEFTFLRTYAWDKAKLPSVYGEGAQGVESWADCCIRVVNAIAHRAMRFGYTQNNSYWRSMCLRMYEQKWSPPGRGLRFMGTPFIEERDGTPLYNCAAVSTAPEYGGIYEAMRWLFMACAYGTGVGYDTVGVELIQPPLRSPEPWVVADSREGWADFLQHVYGAYTGRHALQEPDVSQVREKGAPVNGLGGTASGPEPLLIAYKRIRELLNKYIGRHTDSAFIVDLMNIQAVAILSGGTRRSALIALGEPGDEVFAALKSNPEAPEWAWRWASNHSIRNPAPRDHATIAAQCVASGEPAPIYIDFARQYGRLIDGRIAPHLASAFLETLCNPCGEQLLAHRELCNIAEVVLSRHVNARDLYKSAEYAYLYCKIVTTYDTFDAHTNRVQRAHRRVGVGITGFADALELYSRDELRHWLDAAYRHIKSFDVHVSDVMDIPTSVRLTTVKPSGTASLVLGCSPGVHYHHAPFYLRRVRVSDASRWLEPLRRAGYHVEPDKYAPNTQVVTFPVASGARTCKADVSLCDKLRDVQFLQTWWSDNMVSCTADYDARTEGDEIAPLLDSFGGKSIKSVSFLAREEHSYVQPPYESISEDEYNRLLTGLRPLVYDDSVAASHEANDAFCDGGSCEVRF